MQSSDVLEKHFRLALSQKNALKKLGIKTVLDLLYHFPTRYGDTSEMKNIANLNPKRLKYVKNKSELFLNLKSYFLNQDIIFTLGAGDVYKLKDDIIEIVRKIK